MYIYNIYYFVVLLFYYFIKLTIFVGSWQYSVNRRQFFETYAADNNFDPLVADNWYRQSREQIMSTGVSRPLFLFFLSFCSALFFVLLLVVSTEIYAAGGTFCGFISQSHVSSIVARPLS